MKGGRLWTFISGGAIIAFIIAFCLLYVAFDEPVNAEAIRLQYRRKSNPYNKQLVDSAIQLLRTGDVVVRTGADVTSYMFTQMNRRDKTYSHCGIVSVEKGYPFVYHSIGGEDNPDQTLKKDSASFWFSPAHNLGFGIVRFAADSEKIDRMAYAVHQLYAEKIKFDMDFDLKTNDRLYCAEFVYKILNKTMNDSAYIQTSEIFGYRFVGIDDLFLNRHAKFIWQVRYK